MKKMLKCMPHGHAHVEEREDGSKALISYSINVATIDKDGWLIIHGLHSPTTKRHIVAFIDEYVYGCQSKAEQFRRNLGTYQTMVAMFEAGWKLDINTGEVQQVNPEG